MFAGAYWDSEASASESSEHGAAINIVSATTSTAARRNMASSFWLRAFATFAAGFGPDRGRLAFRGYQRERETACRLVRASRSDRRTTRRNLPHDADAAHARKSRLSTEPSGQDSVCLGERGPRGGTGRRGNGVCARAGYPRAVLSRLGAGAGHWRHALRSAALALRACGRSFCRTAIPAPLRKPETWAALDQLGHSGATPARRRRRVRANVSRRARARSSHHLRRRRNERGRVARVDQLRSGSQTPDRLSLREQRVGDLDTARKADGPARRL